MPSLRVHIETRDLRTEGLRHLRTKFGLTNERCAETVSAQLQIINGRKVSTSSWRSWERKKRPVNMQQLSAIQNAFNLQNRQVHALVDWFMSNHEDQDDEEESS